MTLAVDVDEVFVLHRSGSRGIAALQGLSLQIAEGEIVVARRSEWRGQDDPLAPSRRARRAVGRSCLGTWRRPSA